MKASYFRVREEMESDGARAMNEGSRSLLNRRLFFIGEENRKF